MQRRRAVVRQRDVHRRAAVADEELHDGEVALLARKVQRRRAGGRVRAVHHRRAALKNQRGDIVTVTEPDTTVRIWIDEQNAQD